MHEPRQMNFVPKFFKRKKRTCVDNFGKKRKVSVSYSCLSLHDQKTNGKLSTERKSKFSGRGGVE